MGAQFKANKVPCMMIYGNDIYPLGYANKGQKVSNTRTKLNFLTLNIQRTPMAIPMEGIQ